MLQESIGVHQTWGSFLLGTCSPHWRGPAKVSSQCCQVEWTEVSFSSQTNLNSDHHPFLLITCVAFGHLAFLSFSFLICICFSCALCG